MAILGLLGIFQSCQAPAPRSRAISRLGDVRAPSQGIADEVATLVDEFQPRVLELLPDSRDENLDVWIQEEPKLYRFLGNTYEEADGFWAEAPGRIHLRRDADDLKRTLVHELTHATLGASWDRLPGTIEEGLCDYVSVTLCPDSAPTMRAGRLSAASFAIGGLELELTVTDPDEGTTYAARILLQSGGPIPLDPLDAFKVRAGLSSTTLEAVDKKAFYGLAYIVVDRIAKRHSLEKLHELCRRAEREDEETIPTEWLLEAAGLDANPKTWRRAIAAALEVPELEQLVLMYPSFVKQALAVCQRTLPPFQGDAQHGELGLSLSLPGCTSSIQLPSQMVPRIDHQALAAASR